MVSSVTFLTQDSECNLNISINKAKSLRDHYLNFTLTFLSEGRHRPYVFSYEWCTECSSFCVADSRRPCRCCSADVDS
jgi:hypothetical protein